MSSMPLYLSLLKFNEIVLNLKRKSDHKSNVYLLIYGTTVNEHHLLYGGTFSVG